MRVLRLVLPAILWRVHAVYCAMNIDGTKAVKPATEGDPSPISDSNLYYPDQYDCPLPCVDYSNTHSWTPYVSADRLHRCKNPMLLQFSISQPLAETLVRSCSLGSQSNALKKFIVPMENPKKSRNLFQRSIEFAPACAIDGKKVTSRLELIKNVVSDKGDSAQVVGLLQGMQKYFEVKDNCDESFLFAYHGRAVAGLYIGQGLGKPTIESTIGALKTHIQSSQSTFTNALVQLCGTGRQAERTFGISIDTTGNLEAVQKMALEWSKGRCAQHGGTKSVGLLPNVDIWDISGANGTISTHEARSGPKRALRYLRGSATATNLLLRKRATCRHIEVVPGDSCQALASRCGIPGNDFTKYNSKSDFCATLRPGNFACCSAGDPYTPPKPDAPKSNQDGTCATHFIMNGDSCDGLAKLYGITVHDIEKWNKGKTWAWTECKDMLVGYNMCLSEGKAPLPPPQQGAECGPLVPGTKPPKDQSISLADLNPCPLKACCSNWGFCGVFPAHCDVHAPKGAGPGTKDKGYQNTCVSNCGNEIKKNSDPPSAFQRIGYYEEFSLERDCLWLKAKDANTDGTYTHMHWGFADIDATSWKPVIKDKHKQWEDFKKLSNVKRIVSFGGWAYSTEPATYNIIRQAIIDNRESFASNLAQFVKDEGIDGIDIDWEYPGAPDILVDGQPIGQKGDGVSYLKFLTSLKQKLGSDKSVSIAAPASYWYLKAFPIDRIASVIDYIVYMTYDLHGQWDYGNSQSFDKCPSGKCIRSHINLTETTNALSMVTKAGVPNNKIFVGESSYGRSFHMAQDGCWGPLCEFTGSRTQSDATPGRCTKTGGYLAYAEINEIIQKADGVQTFHDDASNSDIMLYKGDYVSYMTPTTKDTRREDWKKMNFAGTIDWAVDLQAFTKDDLDAPMDTPDPGAEGCISGEDDTVNSGDLCEFACGYGFCPESLCTCVTMGETDPLPKEVQGIDVIAWDPMDVDLNRLCKFACKYGYCPPQICTTVPKEEKDDGPLEVGEDPNYFNYTDARWQNAHHCLIYKNPAYRQASVNQCKPVCQQQLDEAAEEGRISNYGCGGFFPLDKEIPYERYPGTKDLVAPGECICDNVLVNELAQFILDAMPIIAQIGCYILMSSIKLVVDIGAQFIPGVGKAIDAGLDMAITAAQMASYIYPDEEDPEAAFSWWLSPCGGTDLVPDDIKKAFDIMNTVADGVSSFKKPKKIKKGSGKKGDDGNPKDRSKPRPSTGGASGSGVNRPRPTRSKCRLAAPKTERLGTAKNTLRIKSCKNDKTRTSELIVTSLDYGSNPKPLPVTKTCDQAYAQACYHYSSAISNNAQWSTLTCPTEAASTRNPRVHAQATAVWSSQHRGKGWQDKQAKGRTWAKCDRDEYPPAYLLSQNDPAYIFSGSSTAGQSVRYIPNSQNQGAGQMWKSSCFTPVVAGLSDKAFMDAVERAPGKNKKTVKKNAEFEQTMAAIKVDTRPEFSITSWGQPKAPRDGLELNPCWPKGIAPNDPGFALLTYDSFYSGKAPSYDYTKPV